MKLFRLLAAFSMLMLATLTLAGCGKLFANGDDSAASTFGQEDGAANAGVPFSATETVTPDGKSLTILSVPSIQPARIATAHTATDVITLTLSIRSESADFSAVHLKELSHLTAQNGIYSTDSALGCHYALADAGTPRSHIASLSGSCVTAASVEIPDHDVPRAFLGATPLFSGEIELSDVEAVFAAAPHDPGLNALLRSYAARLADAVKPVAVADVAKLIAGLDSDAKRIAAVATLAPRVSDPANAAGTLTKDLFMDPANDTRAVAILAAYP